KRENSWNDAFEPLPCRLRATSRSGITLPEQPEVAAGLGTRCPAQKVLGNHTKFFGDKMRAPLFNPAGLVIVCLVASISTSAIAVADTTYAFNLPEQTLADALRAIGRQTTLNIVFAPETVEHVMAPAIHGDLTAEQAITQAISSAKLK